MQKQFEENKRPGAEAKFYYIKNPFYGLIFINSRDNVAKIHRTQGIHAC